MLGELDNDLIHNFAKPGESAIGERIIVYGRVLDERGKGVAGALLEFWQANAGGRYRHKQEGYHRAARSEFRRLRPHHHRRGRRLCASAPIKPGPYPWPNGANDWRPAHIHFSVFGHGFAQRLITQMYFEGDPMIWQCPIVRTIPDKRRDRDADRGARHAGDHPDGCARLQVRHRAARPPLDAVRKPAGGQLMVQALDRLKETPSQTAGPYVHIGLTPEFLRHRRRLSEPTSARPWSTTRPGASASRSACACSTAPARRCRDALVEIWQADAAGLYNSPAETRGTADPNFAGWGRRPTDMETGVCVFETIKPGRVPFPDGRLMAPHVTVWIVARGINIGLHTRMYFADEESANAEDPLLSRIEHRIARADPDRAARGERLHLRHPSAGGEGNGLLR